MMRKRILIIALVIILLLGGGFAIRMLTVRQLDTMVDGLQTTTVERSRLISTIKADGKVRSQQDVVLTWEISGEIDQVNVEVGDQISRGDLLAKLDQKSLPSYVILAQVDLIEAQQALDDLLNSQTQNAQAKKSVEEAEQSLEDNLTSTMTQAQALVAVAEAEQTLESAERRLGILITPPNNLSVEQVKSNILLTEQSIADLEEDIAELELRLERGDFHPFENASFYKTLYANMKTQLAQLQDRILERQERYDELLAPPDALDVAIAEAEVAAAQANLDEAQREWERVKDGLPASDVAVLEATLSDAQREWERVKDGPTADDIAAAEARVTAADAILNSTSMTAPLDGVVTQVDSKPGDQVSPGSFAFRIDDFSHLYVDLQVSEIEINKVEVGQKVIVTFDAVLAKEYPGEVVDVSPVGEVVDGVVTFEVTVKLSDLDAAIRPGMTSSVEIEVGRLENVLLVPNKALRSLEGQRVVFAFGKSANTTQQNPAGGGRNLPLAGIMQTIFGASPLGEISPIPITIGINSETYSEVIGGSLQAGDVIVIDPPTELLQTFLGAESP